MIRLVDQAIDAYETARRDGSPPVQAARWVGLWFRVRYRARRLQHGR